MNRFPVEDRTLQNIQPRDAAMLLVVLALIAFAIYIGFSTLPGDPAPVGEAVSTGHSATGATPTAVARPANVVDAAEAPADVPEQPRIGSASLRNTRRPTSSPATGTATHQTSVANASSRSRSSVATHSSSTVHATRANSTTVAAAAVTTDDVSPIKMQPTARAERVEASPTHSAPASEATADDASITKSLAPSVVRMQESSESSQHPSSAHLGDQATSMSSPNRLAQLEPSNSLASARHAQRIQELRSAQRSVRQLSARTSLPLLLFDDPWLSESSLRTHSLSFSAIDRDPRSLAMLPPTLRAYSASNVIVLLNELAAGYKGFCGLVNPMCRAITDQLVENDLVIKQSESIDVQHPAMSSLLLASDWYARSTSLPMPREVQLMEFVPLAHISRIEYSYYAITLDGRQLLSALLRSGEPETTSPALH